MNYKSPAAVPEKPVSIILKCLSLHLVVLHVDSAGSRCCNFDVDEYQATANDIQCDEREGGCVKCESYGVDCPGYPEKFDVLLRLQTVRNDEREHRTVSTNILSQPGESSTPSRRQTNEEASIADEPPIDRQLSIDSDHFALAVYFANNCIDGKQTCSLEHIRTQGNGCLFAAIKLLSNIDISRRWSIPDRPHIVTKSYQDAIRLLNAALASPLESLQDSTLISTLILSSVEMKTVNSMASDYWEAHTKGAAALLQLRGATQVTTQLGSSLFFQVSSQLMTCCVLARRRLPPEIIQLREIVRPYLYDGNHPVWQQQGAMIRFVELWAATASIPSNPEGANAIIDEACSIYWDMTTIFQSASPIWQHQKVPSNRFLDLLDYEHSYQTVLATQLWNSCRMAIILLCTIALSVDNDLIDQMTVNSRARHFSRNAGHIINDMALDTIAAIPQGLDLMSKRAIGQASPDGQDRCNKGHTSHAPIFQEVGDASPGLPYMHGCLLQWSVYFGAQSNFVQPRIRKCLWMILDHAGKAMHVKQWQNLAEHLKPIIQNWNE